MVDFMGKKKLGKAAMLKVSSACGLRRPGKRWTPGAAKVMKPGGELNRRGELGFTWVLLGGGGWAEGAGVKRVAGF
jgi:hypothetical protein